VKSDVPSSKALFNTLARPKSVKVMDNQSQFSASDDELATTVALAGRKKIARDKSMVKNTGGNNFLGVSTRRSTRVASGKTAVSGVEDEGTEGESAPKRKVKGKEKGKGKGKKKVDMIEEEVKVEPEPKGAKKTTKNVEDTEADSQESEAITVASTTVPSENKSKDKKKTNETDTVTSTSKSNALTQSKPYAPGRAISPKPSRAGRTRSASKAVGASLSVLQQVARHVAPDATRTDVKVVEISTDDKNDVVATTAKNLPREPTPLSKWSKANGKPTIAPSTRTAITSKAKKWEGVVSERGDRK
jgi:hypothetical protein